MARAFISYARADEKAARRLTSELVKRGVEVSSIDHLVSPGEAWASRLQNEIANSDLVLVLVSSESLRSEYVSAEIALAVSQAERGRTRIVPVLLSPEVQLPALLQYFQAIEFFDPKRAEQQIDRLVQSIGSNSPPTEDQAAQSLRANLNYVRASRRALQAEMAIQASKQAAWSSTVAATVAVLAGIAALSAGIIALSITAPDVVPRWAASFGAGIVGGVLGFLLTAWFRRRWPKSSLPNREAE
jgi:TIR domain